MLAIHIGCPRSRSPKICRTPVSPRSVKHWSQHVICWKCIAVSYAMRTVAAHCGASTSASALSLHNCRGSTQKKNAGKTATDWPVNRSRLSPELSDDCFFRSGTGECGERQLNHSDGEAEKFYRELKQRGVSVRVGMEATWHSRWFERLLAELGFELWIGDAAEIKTKRVRKQKTDREEARLMLKLLLENRFHRIWVPSPENRDLRQLLWHRHRLVRMRTRIMNQLQAVAMNEGYRWKKKLFSEKGRGLLEKLPLAPWASRRRKELFELLGQLDPKIAVLTAAVEPRAQKRPEARRLMTHPGVGPITGLVYVLVIGTPDRFPCGKQLGSYTGLIPCEDSSAGRQRLGHISKQGNKLLRYLLGEAAQAAARCNPDWRRRYVHLMMRRQKRIAKVAMARKLAVRLYWMWRNNWQYSQLVEYGSTRESSDTSMACSKTSSK